MGVRDTVGRVAGAPRHAVVGYWRGITYPFAGLKLVFFQHPGLVRYWIFPIALTLVAFGFAMKGVWDYHDVLFEMMWEPPGGEGFWDGVARFFHGLVEVLFAVVLVAAGFVVVILVSNLFAAPFNDLLSEEVERLVSGRSGPPFSLRIVLLDLARTLAFEGLYLAAVLLLWLASLTLPVVGQIGASVLGFVVTALYWGVSYIDWPASRRRSGLRSRFSLAARHFAAMMGFGTGVWIILFVPLLNLLFMPVAVAGGTLLYLDLEAQDGRKEPPSPNGTAPD